MYTFHEPLIGFIVSKSYYGGFNKALQYIIEEYDLTNQEQLNMELFVEYVEDVESGKISHSVDELEEAKDFLIHFFNWIEKVPNTFNIKKEYHGSDYTPIALEYKKSAKFEYNDCSSYTVSVSDLEAMLLEAKEYQKFCKETMSEKLYNFLEEREDIGLQYLNCSS